MYPRRPKVGSIAFGVDISIFAWHMDCRAYREDDFTPAQVRRVRELDGRVGQPECVEPLARIERIRGSEELRARSKHLISTDSTQQNTRL